MKNITIITLLCAAFFVGCSTNSKLSKKQRKNFYLSVEKTACFGKCPIYVLAIDGTGKADLNAKRFTDNIGQSSANLKSEDMSKLVALSKTADWMNYDSEYLTGYSDLPSTIIRYSKKAGDTTEVRYESDKGPVTLRLIAESLDSLRKVADWKSTVLD
jgi:hypothetical protein